MSKNVLDQTWFCSSDEVKNVTEKYFVHQSEHGSAGSYKQGKHDKLWAMLCHLAPEATAIWKFDWIAKDEY